MAELTNLGFYGKVPSKGDFVSRNLPRTFIDPWDQWLQESIANSQQQLGEQWLENYLTSPIWRFALSKGVCGDNAWTGLVMPSVDSVGRYFPLTLATPVNDPSQLLSIADNEQQWFLQAEDIALSALDQNNNLDVFSQDIDNLGIPNLLNDTTKLQSDDPPKPDMEESDNWRIDLIESEPITNNISSLTKQLLIVGFPQYTLWWSSGSEQIAPSLLLSNKLPATQKFCALLTGEWDLWGWHNTLSTIPSAVDIDNTNPTVRML